MGEVTDALRRAGQEPGRPSESPRVHVEGREELRPEAGSPESEISRSLEGSWQARAVLVNPTGQQADQFRRFALRVRRSLDERGARSVLITSALDGEGKTLTACNLALALASMAGGDRIALVDLDLRRPSVATAMGVAPVVGVEKVLLGHEKLAAARIRTDLPALDLFPVDRPVPNCHEVLAGPTLPALIDELTRQYATVVFDGPPALLAPDVELISPHVGACVLIVKAGVTRRFPFRETIRMIPRENLIGTFLNFSSTPRHARNYAPYAMDESELSENPEEKREDDALLSESHD